MTRYLLIILFLYSCTQKPKHLDPYRWYEHTKAFILLESNLPADSITTEKYEDGRNHKVKALSNGHPTVEKWYRETGEQVVQINYSRDGQFELREEICKDGKPLFEGIFYKSEAYGLSTWWRCGKSKEEEGIRYRNRKIGVWKNWDDNGKITETEYKSGNLIDSLPSIRRNEE